MTPPSIFVTDDDQTYVELAFQRIRDEQPDLVLLDISLLNPGRGWTTLEAMRLHPKTRNIPVIICSTDMHLLDEKAALLRDLNCQTLEKPFDIEAMLDKVASSIGPPPSQIS